MVKMRKKRIVSIVLLIGIFVAVLCFRTKNNIYLITGSNSQVSLSGVVAITSNNYYINIDKVIYQSINDEEIKDFSIGLYYKNELRGKKGYANGTGYLSLKECIEISNLTFKEAIGKNQDVFTKEMMNHFPKDTTIKIIYTTKNDESKEIDISLEASVL